MVPSSVLQSDYSPARWRAACCCFNLCLAVGINDTQSPLPQSKVLCDGDFMLASNHVCRSCSIPPTSVHAHVASHPPTLFTLTCPISSWRINLLLFLYLYLDTNPVSWSLSLTPRHPHVVRFTDLVFVGYTADGYKKGLCHETPTAEELAGALTTA
jgi:hypothetical protein